MITCAFFFFDDNIPTQETMFLPQGLVSSKVQLATLMT